MYSSLTRDLAATHIDGLLADAQYHRLVAEVRRGRPVPPAKAKGSRSWRRRFLRPATA